MFKFKSIFSKKKVVAPKSTFTIYKEVKEGKVYYHFAKDEVVLCGNKDANLTTIPIKEWGIEISKNEVFCQECQNGYVEDRLSHEY